MPLAPGTRLLWVPHLLPPLLHEARDTLVVYVLIPEILHVAPASYLVHEPVGPHVADDAEVHIGAFFDRVVGIRPLSNGSSRGQTRGDRLIRRVRFKIQGRVACAIVTSNCDLSRVGGEAVIAYLDKHHL